MKKWLVGLLVILILAVGSVYFFIPAKIVISAIATTEATITAEYRYISLEDNWEKWWRNADGTGHDRGGPFSYNGTIYRLTKGANNAAGIEIKQNGLVLQSELHLISLSKDSTGVMWKCELPAGSNLFSRIAKYRIALELKKNMSGILSHFKSFISDPKKVYGLTIHRTSTKDTTMLTASFASVLYPTTAELYTYIGILEKSIQKQHGSRSGYPMINVRKTDSGGYETQVALPTNRLLENDGKVVYRRMVPGNFIVAEVKGGPSSVEEGMKQLDYFISDFHKTVMAKPFQLLITDRLSEPDTSKWITKIYIPVVE